MADIDLLTTLTGARSNDWLVTVAVDETGVADPTVRRIPAFTVSGPAKYSVRAASTAALTLATGFENGDTIDGITLATGDRILIKDQASGADNGIYIVAASGAPARAADADATGKLVTGTQVYVSSGTINGKTTWTLTTTGTITLGSTAQVWEKVPRPGTRGTTLASASTVDLSTATGDYVDISGTTTINAFGTVADGRSFELTFTGALTVNHDPAALILPGGEDFVAAAGDTMRLRSLGSGNWRCTGITRASGAGITGGYNGVPTALTGSASESTADIGKLLILNGSAVITRTLPTAFNNVGEWVEYLNISTYPAIISAGSDGINAAGRDYMVLMPGNRARMTYASASDPKWRCGEMYSQSYSVCLSSDQSNITSATLADVTNMGFRTVASEVFEFRFHILFATAAVTTGIKFAPTMANTTILRGNVRIPMAADGTDAVWQGAFTTTADTVTSTDIEADATRHLAEIFGIAKSSADSLLQLQTATEVGGSAITIGNGSFGVMRWLPSG